MRQGVEERRLIQLAHALVCAHIGVLRSAATNWDDGIEGATRMLMRDKSFKYRPTRVVLVVGSGASSAAYGLPTGTEAAAEVEKKATEKHGEGEALYRLHHRRLTTVYRLPAEDFETKLLAWSAFAPQQAREFLASLFKHQFVPCLTYELIAHMFNHRFVTTIVNFNFDELLDQALDDELGRHRYNRITSDGFDERGLDDLPTCIKPHGTASEGSSLRFTREDYFAIPVRMTDLLEGQFSAEERTVVLLVGTSMQSFEFNEIVARRDSENLQIYAIGRSEPKGIREAAPNDPTGQTLKAAFKRGGLIRTDKQSIDATLHKLWKHCARAFNRGFAPRSTKRHELVARLFSRKIEQAKARDDARPRAHASLMQDRALVELALAIAKAKGIVDVRHIAAGRAGAYFQRWYKEEKLGSGARKGGRPEGSLLRFCETLGLRSATYSREDVRLTRVDARTKAREPIRTALDPKSYTAVELTATLLAQLSDATQQQLKARSRVRNHICTTLREMCAQDEVEIDASHVATVDPVFAKAHPMQSFTELRLQTLKLLRETDWDALLCVAESGQWLHQPLMRTELVRSRRSALALIVADEGWIRETAKLRRPVLVKARDWWDHNRHMTVALSGRRPVRAIYFERRLRSSVIRPLLVTDQEELRTLLQIFAVYWTKARRINPRTGKIVEGASDQARYSPKSAEQLVAPLMNEIYKQRAKRYRKRRT